MSLTSFILSNVVTLNQCIDSLNMLAKSQGMDGSHRLREEREGHYMGENLQFSS